mmetsp:Transcript_3141/g.7357  ORF Transcript_3141/g.7357 Transcript_3141/m.7357 type:complete len:244 (+) Transcript_3141:225-956(+)
MTSGAKSPPRVCTEPNVTAARARPLSSAPPKSSTRRKACTASRSTASSSSHPMGAPSGRNVARPQRALERLCGDMCRTRCATCGSNASKVCSWRWRNVANDHKRLDRPCGRSCSPRPEASSNMVGRELLELRTAAAAQIRLTRAWVPKPTARGAAPSTSAVTGSAQRSLAKAHARSAASTAGYLSAPLLASVAMACSSDGNFILAQDDARLATLAGCSLPASMGLCRAFSKASSTGGNGPETR